MKSYVCYIQVPWYSNFENVYIILYYAITGFINLLCNSFKLFTFWRERQGEGGGGGGGGGGGEREKGIREREVACYLKR